LGGKSAKYTIGPYPVYSLKQARDAAAIVLRSVSEGINPKQRRAGSVAEAVEHFLSRGGKKNGPKALYECTRRMHDFLGNWGTRKLDSITRADVRSMVDAVDAPIAANRVHSVVRTFFNWCVENDLIANSPVSGVKAPHKETPRDRVLTDDELRAVWLAAEK